VVLNEYKEMKERGNGMPNLYRRELVDETRGWHESVSEAAESK
jgi:hypothetical protein